MLSDTSHIRATFFYGLLTATFLVAFYPAIQQLVSAWYGSDDYSHGFAIIPISLFVIWNKRGELVATTVTTGPGGAILIGLMIAGYVFGHLAEIATVSSLALVGAIWALVWYLFGPVVFRKLLFPLFLLLFMIPVPAQFYSMATIPLQLFVSKVSATAASFLGVPILREGNVLHLPEHTLAVVQACSGLRSLMSLLTLCTVFGYLTLQSNLLRALLIASGLPAAILVNIIRVLVMVVALHYFNYDLAVGTKHTVFGALVFCLALIIVALSRESLSRWDPKPYEKSSTSSSA